MSFIIDYVFTFNRMVTPFLLTAVYWLFAFILLIMALQAPDLVPLSGFASNLGLPAPVVSLLGFAIGLGVLRIFFEMMILMFKMYDVMLKIAENTPSQETPRAEPARSLRLVDRDQVRFSADDA